MNEIIFDLQRFDITVDNAHDRLVSGTSGNDVMTLMRSYNCTMSGGVGNDRIHLDGNLGGNVIYGGKGNDTLSGYRSTSSTCYYYVNGDGYDVIYGDGYNGSLDFIQIMGGYYSKSTVGNNLVINVYGNDSVANGAMTVTGGVNRVVNVLYSTAKELPSNYFYNTADNTVISGTSSADTVRSRGSKVTINAGAGNDTITAYGNSNVINGDAGNDHIDICGQGVFADGGEGDDLVEVSESVTISSSGYETVLSTQGSTLRGGSGNDTIISWYDNSFIYGDSGNDTIAVGGNKVVVYGGDGNDFIEGSVNNGTIYGGNGNNKIDCGGDNSVFYGGNDGNSIEVRGGGSVTVYGGNGLDVLRDRSGKSVFYGGAGDDDLGAIVSGNSTFVGGTGNDMIGIIGPASTDTSNNSVIQYAAGDGNDTILNFASGDNLLHITSGSISNSVISGNNLILTVGNGTINLQGVKGSTINLKLANGTTTTLKAEAENENPKWTISGTTATYGTSSQTLCTITGLKSGTSKSNISLSGSTVTLKAAALGTSEVKISGDYKLALASDVETPSEKSESWSISGTKATYQSGGTTAGYTLADDGKSITYSAAIDGETLFTVSGLKSGTSKNNLSLSDSTVTLKAAALGTSKVTISGSYKLALADDVSAPEATTAGFTISGTTATYKSKGTSEGYTLANDKKSVSYTAASGGNNLFTVSGLKSGTSKSNLSLSGKTVTLKAAALGTSKVTISDGYTLALASNVTKTSTKKAAWSYSNSTSTYKSSYKIAGYSLASDGKSISYTKATSATTLAKINGTKSNSGISLSDKKIITLKNSSLKSKVTVSGSYEFDFAKDYKNATITGSANADSITARGSKIKINGGAGADSIKSYGSAVTMTGGAGADVFVYGAGTGVISDYQEADKIRILSGKASVSTSGNDAIFTVGKGKITVKGGKKKEITYFDSSGKHTYVYKEKPYTINSKGTAITLSSAYLNETFDVTKYGSAIQAIDASAVVLNLNIKGNKLANKIIGSSQDDTLDGGAGADTLLGGKGSDSLSGGKGDDSIIGGAGSDTLTGGAGSDVFVYNKGDGNDKISDYEEDDIIQIKGDKVSKIKSSGKNVVFTLESSKKITVANSSNKVITYSVNGKEKTYIADMSKYVTFNKKGTSAKLKSSYPLSSFTPTDYSAYSSSLVTIDASAMQNELQIVGNGKANVIIGGTQDDTINGGAGSDKIKGGDGSDSIFGGKGDDELHGGKGKDTLWGGAGDDELYGDDGKDVFYYKPGEGSDTIFGYEASVDSIVLSSGAVDNVAADRNNNVIFTIGDGQIVVNKGADRIVKIVNPSGNIVKNGLYEP